MLSVYFEGLLDKLQMKTIVHNSSCPLFDFSFLRLRGAEIDTVSLIVLDGCCLLK